jgi:glucose-6-phosphate 1-dehydrogenase
MYEGVTKFVRETPPESDWAHFAKRLDYVSGNYAEPSDYASLRQSLNDAKQGDSNRLYYLATPPSFFAQIVHQLGAGGMVKEQEGWRRVVVEKPFGRDLESARSLNQELHRDLTEDQIYRIDHYLAKETVQNILVLRFGNTIFEPLWNRNYIDHVQITAAESVDVGRRGGYYDQSGVLRDMFQNHLLQLLALVAMEPPASFEADALRNERSKALASVRGITPENLSVQSVRAQYDGYLDAPNVGPVSTTATYAALCLYVDNWRWQGVPFYLRSGKALAKKNTEIVIQFKAPPHMMFPLPKDYEIKSNMLSLCIQPHEGMHLRFEVKVPDTPALMRSMDMDFHYEDGFGVDSIPEAYERLLFNALEGDASLFTRSDGIEIAWQLIDSISKGWNSESAPRLETYRPGSWGPKGADKLLTRDGRKWTHGCEEH